MMSTQIATMKRLYALQTQLTAITHHSIGVTKEMAGVVHDVERSHCRILRTSSGRFEVTSTGKDTATISQYAGR